MEFGVVIVRKGAEARRLSGEVGLSQVRITSLIYIGLILNLSWGFVVECAPVIELGSHHEGTLKTNVVAADSRSFRTLSNNINQINTGRDQSVGSTSAMELQDSNSDTSDETDRLTLKKGRAPILLLPKYLKHDNNVNMTAQPDLVMMEYKPSFVIRCAAKSNPKPNVTWEYNGGSLPEYVALTGHVTRSNPHTGSHSEDNSDDTNAHLSSEKDLNKEAWIDLELPKLNNAFYGRLRCRAENLDGNSTWEIELIHNANSSLFMKLVRGTIAVVAICVGMLVLKGLLWVKEKQTEKLYEKLPAQDLEIIKKFKTGLGPPPPSPASSVAPTLAPSPVPGCVSTIEITVTTDTDGKIEGYRPVKHELSFSDLQKRGGGSSTPTSCVSVHVMDSVNSWTNYVPYDDKMETSSQHFNVDFSKMIESGSYGMIFAGKVRNDLTMQWSSVAVKTGKTERDDNFMLESILTELKILANLPKPHDNIVNLKGAYTKLLHKRQAYVFVDYCENGNLAKYIDLNRQNFVDIFCHPGVETSSADSGATTSTNNNFKPDNSYPLKLHKKETDGISASFTSSGRTILSDDESPQVAINLRESKVQAFTIQVLLSWAWQIADGMNFLHKNRIIHGNLSSVNIYLTSKLAAKVGNIGYPPSESLECIDATTKKWLTIPNFEYEHFSKKSDLWDYGSVLWEVFSLRMQQCPDKHAVNELMQGETWCYNEEIEVPDYATQDTFELMLCCWNENATLCPEFDFFLKAFKQLHKEMFSAPSVTKQLSIGSTSTANKSQLSLSLIENIKK